MHDGLLGLILFISHWLFPAAERASLSVHFDKVVEMQAVQFQSNLDIAWNRRLEQLVDAGIPLRFKILSFTDCSDTVMFYRSLYFDMVHFTYMFIDSSGCQISRSQQYSLIHLALRDYTKWKIKIPQEASVCRIEAHILPSRAEQLNRVVDMSRVWGQQKVLFQFDPRKKVKRKSQRGQ